MPPIDLIQVETSDSIPLHGLLFTPNDKEKEAIIMLHGVGGNFYGAPLPQVAKRLSEKGYVCLTANTRGHDWISGCYKPEGFIGAAFEAFDDTLSDLDAIISFLESSGRRRIILLGHSLGGTKVLYYQAKRQHALVRAIVACSVADLSYESRVKRVKDFAELYHKAEQYLTSGRGGELIRVPAPAEWASETIFTANTLIDKYHLSSRNDAAGFVSKIECPMLMTAGSEEKAHQEYAKKLQNASQNPKCTLKVIDGAGHFYKGRENILADTIDNWLKGNQSALNQ